MLKTISFLYHEVCDDPSDSGFQRLGALPYTFTINHFRSNIELIYRIRNQASLCTSKDSTSEEKFFLTFDDGGISALKSADIIEEKGWKAHFFVTTSKIGSQGFLGKSDIIELYKRGHNIGSHSHTHPDIFRSLNETGQTKEWQMSKNILENIIQDKVITASVPGGDMNYLTIKSAKNSFIKHLFTSEASIRPQKFGSLNVYGRFCPKNTTSDNQIKSWSKGKGVNGMRIRRVIKDIVKRTPVYWIYSSYTLIPTNRND